MLASLYSLDLNYLKNRLLFFSNPTVVSSPCPHTWELKQINYYCEVTTPENYEVTTPENYEVTTPENYEVTTPENYEVTTPENYEVTTPENYEVITPEGPLSQLR
ncbi:MAG: hypothetical protein ATN31_02100 [Candidatus Epulonipiscioides saccharophilum]|nr:MAG: hypothetical protein ATN31_02100 [Epulopiscium sp. AS2M-Bin001]